MKTKLNKTFIIVNKLTRENWTASSGKSSWRQAAHAKTAWKGSYDTVPSHLHGGKWNEPCRFDEQSEFEIVELKSDDYYKLQEACELIREIFDYDSCNLLDPNLANKLCCFIEENLKGE